MHPRLAAVEAPPEATEIRLHKMVGICIAPQYVAEEFLYAEVFTEVQYVEVGLLRLYLSGAGHCVEVAGDGEEGFAKTCQLQPTQLR